MTYSKLLLCGALMVAPGLSAAAAGLPEAMVKHFDTNAIRFVKAAGYTQVDTQTLMDRKYYSTNMFPGQKVNSAFSPDADLDPVTKAILVLESREIELPRVRYRVTYNVESWPDMPEAQQSYIEVTRFNMGPIIMQDLLGSMSTKNVAQAKEFGVGPHVSWRFSMASRMGMRADINNASRKVLSRTQAGTADCLGEPCLSIADPDGPIGKWRATRPAKLPKPVYRYLDKPMVRPARVAEELLAVAVPEGLQSAQYKPDSPRMVFVISMNVVGQDYSSLGLVHDKLIMDDAISATWTRRMQIADMPVEFSVFDVPRKR